MAFPTTISERLQENPVLATVSISSPSLSVPTIEALVEGGICNIELTLRNQSSLESLALLCEAFRESEVLIGVGTVLTEDQLRAVVDLGAGFAVAPGCNPKVVGLAKALDFPFAPGVATPSDVEMALDLGCNWLKLFPAEALGGLSYLGSLAAPYAHRGVKFIPLGGINVGTMTEYLSNEHVGAIGGSWLATAGEIEGGDFTAITEKAGAAAKACELALS